MNQMDKLDPMYLDRSDYDEMKRREAIVIGMFLQQAEQMFDKEKLDQVRERLSWQEPLSVIN